MPLSHQQKEIKSKEQQNVIAKHALKCRLTFQMSREKETRGFGSETMASIKK